MTDSKMEKAYEAIRSRIAAGTLTSGSQLVNRALAEELGVSTVTVREAIHRLTSDGLVEYVPNAGAFVRTLNQKEMVSLYEFRHALDVFAVTKAAANISRQNLSRLEEICIEFQAMVTAIHNHPLGYADGDLLRDWISRDMLFHETLYDAADNLWLRRAVDNLDVLKKIINSKPPRLTMRDAKRTAQSHTGIVEGIRNGDTAEAVKWMRIHNDDAINYLMRHPPEFNS